MEQSITSEKNFFKVCKQSIFMNIVMLNDIKKELITKDSGGLLIVLYIYF